MGGVDGVRSRWRRMTVTMTEDRCRRAGAAGAEEGAGGGVERPVPANQCHHSRRPSRTRSSHPDRTLIAPCPLPPPPMEAKSVHQWSSADERLVRMRMGNRVSGSRKHPPKASGDAKKKKKATNEPTKKRLERERKKRKEKKKR